MRHTARSSRRLGMLVATASAVAIATTFLTPPASAAEWDVVASGLDNPRQLSFRGSSLYVAEAGKGGGGPCIEGPEGDSCLGLSGAITRVKNGNQSRVLTGLPSLAAPDGSGAIGPSDVVVVRDNRYTVSIGLGNDPAVKEDLGWRGRRLATIIRGTFGQKGPRVVANIADFEAANDPDGLGPDTNPVSILKRGSRLNVVDAGGNALLRVARKQIRVLTTFDSPGNAPAQMGGFPIQPVPTAVALGPDGAFYISELTGFPFLPGIARIHRWVPGMPTTVYATGLTNVTELVGRVTLFIPKVIVAVLILALGAYFARFIENTILAYSRNIGLEDAEVLGRFARYAVLVFVVMIALEQVDVASELVRQSFLIILAGVVFALALAFGLGAQYRVSDLLEKWWPSKKLQQKSKE